MMVPHHQGAIDMARAEPKYGRNGQLRRLSQEFIVTQQQEIAPMRLAVGDPLPPSAASPTQPDVAPAPRPGAMPPVRSDDAMSPGSIPQVQSNSTPPARETNARPGRAQGTL